MSEIYSRGNHAVVYRWEGGEHGNLYLPANLVRNEPQASPNETKALFYKHKIAQILFPENFIDVIAVRHEAQRDELSRSQLFSLEAQISVDHALFSSHIREVDDWGKVLCVCPACAQHARFHESAGLGNKVVKTAKAMEVAGIVPPFSDISDYCESEENIVFFEIEDFFPQITRNYLESMIEPTRAQERALVLLGRYDVLTQGEVE